MKYSEMRQLIDNSVEFPITHDSLVEQLGTVELTPPTGDSVPVSEILTRCEEPTYSSAEMLYTTIIGNLDERFIGRKYYDDRSGSHTRPDPRRSTIVESNSRSTRTTLYVCRECGEGVEASETMSRCPECSGILQNATVPHD